MKRRTISTTVLIALAAGCGYVVSAVALPSARAMLGKVNSRPHTALIEVDVWRVDGSTPKHLGVMTTAHDHAGNKMIRFQRPGWPTLKTPRRLILADGRSIAINDAAQLRSTTHVTDPTHLEQMAQLQLPASTCVKPGSNRHLLKRESLAGQQVEVIQFQHSDLRLTQWQSPTLGCARLKYTIERRLPDKTYVLATVGELHSLSLADPPAEFFNPHLQYGEVSPPVFEAKLRQSLGYPEVSGPEVDLLAAPEGVRASAQAPERR